jgi:hypothetical protein
VLRLTNVAIKKVILRRAYNTGVVLALSQNSPAAQTENVALGFRWLVKHVISADMTSLTRNLNNNSKQSVGH